MRVGVLDILAPPSRHPADTFYHLFLTKQFASITPQAVSVWCRRLGHETFYATYYGVGDAHSRLPADLDIVFISCYTQASPLAYALGKLYRKAGIRTVIGGPHAKAFPADCQRFFDLVVKECDQELLADILSGQYDPGALISSDKPLEDVPTVEERMPEIRSSAFYWGRGRLPLTTVPMLASTGCPYSCNFCIDWNNAYRALPLDRLAEDMRYLSHKMNRILTVFHDPNFAVKFDEIFDVLELLPPRERPPYIIESSLTVLRGDRVKRLKDTNCVMVAPGVESWTDYSNKAGMGRTGGVDKVDGVAEHFGRLYEQVPYLQANFMFGLDTDIGDTPIELTKRFMDQTPYVWPTINIPVPFGGTPLYDDLLSTDRVLTEMPFGFYYSPYLVTTLKNYDPVTYYEKLVELYGYSVSPEMLKRRMQSTSNRTIKLIHRARTGSTRAAIKSLRTVLDLLRTDTQFRDFHERRSSVLPEFYHHTYERGLKQYAGLISRADRAPDLQHDVPSATHATPTAQAVPEATTNLGMPRF